MPDLVGILLDVSVPALHSTIIRCAVNTCLSGVNVIFDTKEKSDNDHGRDTLQDNLDVLDLVILAITNRIAVQEAHGLMERAALLVKFVVEPFLSFGNALLVGHPGKLSLSSARLLSADRRIPFWAPSEKLLPSRAGIGLTPFSVESRQNRRASG